MLLNLSEVEDDNDMVSPFPLI